VFELEVIDRPEAAALVLDPTKRRILAALGEPASAASLAGRVGLTRQKVNYHLRALEAEKLVEPVEERRWGGITERMMVASARSYVVSPAALGAIAADPARSRDRLSASYLIALAWRVVREVGELWRRARRDEKRLATLSLDLVVAFESPDARAAFTRDLTRALTQLVARYHDERSPGARPHRLIVASYPAPPARS
jgi:DNA-binding transcriptional ArsR family regulator